MSSSQSDLARMMRIFEQVEAQGSGLPRVSRKQKRAAARSALKQARAEQKEYERAARLRKEQS
ncbi:Uncharacterised protein [Mycobacteroides abscessus subsp. abscessus]|uniref:30S ribosomal protein S21 n=1 Tax=Mycobacteroides abscessus TaxID=36809 RepID=A0AB33TFA7_9MYCO|nr:hypothetical protein [Mycobacteroides abscessus]MBN7531879.1 hypothetical protein [Mycobacteroides abscessus subsp. abscessus]MDO3105271.1 hypothetical protein [Mycobacteroides abscessus subsp. abscessus]CPT39602.1 Uncharacterised protein [Mycobacteroides abscessus]CPT59532.1 Uncharacterised protein [Mycobacteroides abscessus]CPT71185.1 Uncharacterised protein [Mycobacteroides abscessus]